MEPPLDAKVIRPGGWKAYLGGSLALFGSSAIPSCFFAARKLISETLGKNRTQVLRAAWGTGREFVSFWLRKRFFSQQ